MKQGVIEKRQMIYLNLIAEVITEVGKSQPSTGDITVKAIINHLITGQVGLNFLTSKIDKNKSANCETTLIRKQLTITFSTVKSTNYNDKFLTEKS